MAGDGCRGVKGLHVVSRSGADCARTIAIFEGSPDSTCQLAGLDIVIQGMDTFQQGSIAFDTLPAAQRGGAADGCRARSPPPAFPGVSATARAQAYPTRPITMIVPLAAGEIERRIGKVTAKGGQARERYDMSAVSG
jgi:hypothetical protein